MIATRPATAPEMAPSTVGLPARHHSSASQPSVAVEAAAWVAIIAIAARPPALPALPALKPSQPTHSNEAPMTA